MARTFEELKARHVSRVTYAKSAGYTMTGWAEDCGDLIEMVEALQDMAHPHALTRGQSPLVCYFANEADREEFKKLVVSAMPGARAVKVP